MSIPQRKGRVKTFDLSLDRSTELDGLYSISLKLDTTFFEQMQSEIKGSQVTPQQPRLQSAQVVEYQLTKIPIESEVSTSHLTALDLSITL